MESSRTGTRIVRHETPASFLAVCGEWLSEQEDIHNGMLSLADGIGSGKHIHTPPFVFAHIEDTDHVVGCAIFAEPDGITLSEMPVRVAGSLFEDFVSDIRKPSRIHGPRGPAIQLASYYSDLTSTTAVIHSEWNIHRLDNSPPTRRTADGAVRVGNSSDADLVSAWGKSYNAEKPANIDIEKFLGRKLEDGLLYFWIDPQPKALLTLSGINCSGNRISSVFTPEPSRSKGYATSLVQEVSSNLIEAGKAFVTLNTENGDPAERIYERLGFKMIGERVSIVFASDAPNRVVGKIRG